MQREINGMRRGTTLAEPSLMNEGTTRGDGMDRTEALATLGAMTSKVAASDAYVRRGGRWQSLYYQETPLK